LRRHVRPESIIVSDMWRGYLNIENNLDCYHLTVNHSQNFVNPDTGACTNTIEGTWNGLKFRIPPRNRIVNGIDEHLWEFIWRRKNSNNLWDGFLNALRDIIYE
jgi:ISXO2-like transposase domain